VLLGSCGELVKALEQEFLVKISFTQIKEQGKIEGPPDNVAKAKDRLQSVRTQPVIPLYVPDTSRAQILEYHQLYDDFCELSVNQKVFNRLRSTPFRRECQSELGLRELHIRGDKYIRIRGSKIVLEKAQEHFYRLQEKLDGESTVILTKDIDQLSRLVNGQDWSDIVRACNGPSDPQLQKDLVIR
jgi:hypothetical protein